MAASDWRHHQEIPGGVTCLRCGYTYFALGTNADDADGLPDVGDVIVCSRCQAHLEVVEDGLRLIDAARMRQVGVDAFELMDGESH